MITVTAEDTALIAKDYAGRVCYRQAKITPGEDVELPEYVDPEQIRWVSSETPGRDEGMDLEAHPRLDRLPNPMGQDNGK